ncbi:translationally-controlled tumor protein [Streptomyces sp. C3-3]|uniref:translationally-controlled tumor protein n=1 Tax=Streptomyces sp. C3-3 TaxID=2824901 RepID=UPI001B372FC2|nr:translationally-controlled tumor protein [Streptomyces sp. C3-3]
MIVYKDRFNGDELASDSFPVKDTGLFLEVDCKTVSRQKVGSLSGAGLDGGDGSDAEAEAGEVIAVIDLVGETRMVETSYDRKSYLGHIKAYTSRLRQVVAEGGDQNVEEWQTAVAEEVNRVVASFGDWKFYTGESMDPDAMVPLLGRREDGQMYFRFFKDGLVTEEH